MTFIPNNQDTQLMASIAMAGEGNQYADRFVAGSHTVILNNFEFKDTQSQGRLASVDFVCADSTVPGIVGRSLGEPFFISVSDQKGGKANKQRCFALAKAVVQSLGGDPDDMTPVIDANGAIVMVGPGQPLTKGVALVQQTLLEMSRKDQPWRGVALRADGTAKITKEKKTPYTQVKYSPITQTAEQIAAARARIEGASTPATTAAPAAPVTTSLLKR